MSSRQQAPDSNHVCPWWLAYTFDNHVFPEAFQNTLEIAQSTGLLLCGQPAIRFSLTALFESD
jgi:hypothetical protein